MLTIEIYRENISERFFAIFNIKKNKNLNQNVIKYNYKITNTNKCTLKYVT